MNKRYDKNYGKKDEEEDEEPVRLTLRQRIAEHRLRHPHDLISFGEDPIPKPHKPQLSKREKPSGEFLISRYETRLIEGAKEEEDEDSDENEEYQVTWTSESLLECSVSELKTMSSIMFREFMELKDLTVEDVQAGWLPIDSQGEPIERAKGAGNGKNGWVNWMMRYMDDYLTIRRQRALTDAMNQTLLG